MHKIIEDVYVCSALFVAIACTIILFTTIPKTPYRLYERILIVETLVCLPLVLLETRRSFRHKPRTIGGLAVVSSCCRGIVFAFGFHYLWNHSTFGVSGAIPALDFDLVESLMAACCVALGIGFLNCMKKHVCLPRKQEGSILWEFAFGWSLSESVASLQCEAGVGICIMMLIDDWRRRRVVDVLVLPKPMSAWTFAKFLIFMSRLLTTPFLLRFLYTMNLSRVSSSYVYEHRVLTYGLGPLALLQIFIGAWFGLANPYHHVQVLLASAYLALLMLSNFLLNINRTDSAPCTGINLTASQFPS